MRQVLLIAGWIALVLTLTALSWYHLGWAGFVGAVIAAVTASVVFLVLLFRQTSGARRGAHAVGGAPHPVKEEDISIPDVPARAIAPPPPAAVDLGPAGPALVADHFPWPLGTPGTASMEPWRISGSPGPAGICADSALVGDLHVRAASIVGPSHRCQEPAMPRQDAYRLGVDQARRHLIVAVADGMSDSSHSDLGANVAADTIATRLRSVLAERRSITLEDLGACFGSAAKRMTTTAEQRGLQPDDVRAAALGATIELVPNSGGGREVLLATIADVSGWLRQECSWRQVAGDTKQGMDAGHLSAFLPHFPSQVILRRIELAPGDVLALTTDGIGDVLLGPGRLAEWFTEQWERPPSIGGFIDTVGFEAKGRLDDRTAVVIWSPGRCP
ncbi:protein phosphatase 2C domain-containing protein [Nonomuraea sp. NPDC050547]|uniref:protein phosphatase 2C domain-containing protein n=1 Tax=Nonomuraea sp. NPDC050547 TaxID=3364368 RepID=UPI0037AFD537